MKALPDTGAAVGGVGGDAQLIGSDGKAITFGGAPNLGFSVDPAQPSLNSLSLVSGRWPNDGEVVIDESTAGKKDLKIGQEIGVQAEGPTEQLRISGFVKFGSVSSIGGATLAGFTLPTAQQLFEKPGKLDQIRVAAKDGVTPDPARRRDPEDPPAGHAGADRRGAGGGGRIRHERVHLLPAHVPARLRRASRSSSARS